MVQMPKEVRRRIFYCLIAAFLVLGTGIVLYAQGWRLGFQPLGFAKVGAMYVRTFPADAKVTLDGKLKERRIGWIGKGTLLGDLLPGEYELGVSAPGFQPLAFSVVVSSTIVTNMQNLVLVPDTPTLVTSTTVRDITLAGTTLLLQTASGTHTLAGMPIRGGTVLAASEDGAVILSYATSSRNYYAAETARATSTNLGRLPNQASGRDVLSFQPVPRDDTLFLAKSSVGLHLIRMPSGETLRLTTTSVIAAAAAPGRIVWATFDAKAQISLLSSYDIPSRNRNADFELVPGRVTSLLFLGSGEIFAHTQDGSLYSMNLGQSSRVRLAQNVRSIAPSRDDSKLAILDGRGVEIVRLRGDEPDLWLALPDIARVQKLVWHRDGDHLFVHYPDKVAFLDLRDTALRNFSTAAPSAVAEYEPNGNILYFLKDNMLYKLEFPNS